jgi:hypothetical protein
MLACDIPGEKITLIKMGDDHFITYHAMLSAAIYKGHYCSAKSVLV